ncbi:serine hydrolase domain-containing protein [Luteipulveratus flavus]|uniref:Serine hydrolase n=1 Tax=Luteipulveratus flavus TaxID=3031728 RepID=A0ABT6CDM3_9MICO|nr:serine hydrolase domain-containing protein [Luteipulveratus sp. YIM 133296]MDF8266382.1 serine hydrolase [Luteipulveratus sp. YIM 133296]
MQRSRRITDALDPLVQQGHLPGYAFAVRERGVLHEGRGGVVDLESGAPVTASTAFRIASLSKLVGAVVTLQQVDAGRLALDDPIGRWLPELAHPIGPDGQPARVAITIRHLLTMTSGWGVLYGGEDRQAEALAERGIAPGASAPPIAPETYLSRLAEVPLAAQPGEVWRYHTSSDVLSILLERLTGSSNDDLVQQGVVQPLGLGLLSFEDAGEVATWYESGPDGLVRGQAGAPGFRSFGNGLVTRPADYLRVLEEVASERPTILRPESARAIRSPQISEEQRRAAAPVIDPWTSYGWQVSVNVEDTPAHGRAGTFGWSGGTGCVAGADPASDVAGVYLGTRAMGGPTGSREFDAFWDAVYA